MDEDEPGPPENLDNVGDVTGEDANDEDDEDGQHLGNELLAADEDDDIVDEREASDRVRSECIQSDNNSRSQEQETVNNEFVGHDVESRVEESSDQVQSPPAAESKRELDQEQRDSVEETRTRGNIEQHTDAPFAEDRNKPGFEAQRGFDRSDNRRHDSFRKEELGDSKRGAGQFETRRQGHFDERPSEEMGVKRMDSFEQRRPNNMTQADARRGGGTDFLRGDGGETWRGEVPGRRNDGGEPWRGEGSGRRNDSADPWRGEMTGSRRADIDGRRVEGSGQWRGDIQDVRRADGPPMRRVENDPRRVENFRGADASENRRVVEGQPFVRAEGDPRRPDLAEFRRLEGPDRREIPDTRRDGPGARRNEGQDFARFSDRRDNHRRFDGPDHNRFETVDSRGPDTLSFRRDNLPESGWQGDGHNSRPNLPISKGRAEPNDPRRIGDLSSTVRMDGPETNRPSVVGNRDNFRGSPQDWPDNRRGQDVRRGTECGQEHSQGQHQAFRPPEHSDMSGRGVDHVETGWRGGNSEAQLSRTPTESQRMTGLNERSSNDSGRIGPKDASVEHGPSVLPVPDRNSFSSARNLDPSRIGGKPDSRLDTRFVTQNQGMRADERFAGNSGKFAGDNLLVNVSASSTDGSRKVIQSQGFRGQDIARDQQRPDIVREQRPDIVREQRPDIVREQRLDIVKEQRPDIVRDQSYEHPRLSAVNEPVRTNSSDRVGFSEREGNFYQCDGIRNLSVSNGPQVGLPNAATQSRGFGESKVRAEMGSNSFNSSSALDGRSSLKSERSFNSGNQLEQYAQKEHVRDFNDVPGFGANQQRPKTLNRDVGNVEPSYDTRQQRDVLQHQGAALPRHAESFSGQEPRSRLAQPSVEQSAGFQHQIADGNRRAQYEHHAGQGFGQAGEALTGPSGVQDRFIQQQRELPLTASPGNKLVARKPVAPAIATVDVPNFGRQLVNQGLASPKIISTSAASSTVDVGQKEHVVVSTQSDPRAGSNVENQHKKRKAEDGGSSAEVIASAGRGVAATVTREIATQKPRVVSLKAITQAHNPEPVNPEIVVQKRFRKHDGSAGPPSNEGNRGNWNGPNRGRGGFHNAGSGWRGHGQG